MNKNKIITLIENNKESIIQFIKFGMVGALNTFLSIFIDNFLYYIVLTKIGIFGENVTLMAQVSNFITFMITVFISFMLNGHFVFQPDSNVSFWKSLFKVYASYSVTSLFLNGILKFIEVSIFGLPYFLATFINLVFTIPINFLLNKFWAYK